MWMGLNMNENFLMEKEKEKEIIIGIKINIIKEAGLGVNKKVMDTIIIKGKELLLYGKMEK